MEGPQWTTGSIGRRCKPGNGLSRPVLIGRHEPHTPTHPRTPAPAPERAGAGGEPDHPRPLRSPEPTHPTPHTRGAGHQGPRTTTPPPSRRPQRAGKRPDPYRTRKLSPPAPMVLPPPGSGRVGHHRNTHHRPARGRRPNQAPTPTRAKPTNTPLQHNEGYSAGSWWRSPVRTTCVALDHGGPTVVLECEVRVSASGARRRRAPRSARSPGNRRDRHLTREHVCQRYVLAGRVTISRVE